MSKFSLSYKHRQDYDDKIEVEISLKNRPLKEDYQKMLDAIKLLDEIRAKYLPPIEPPKKEK